MTTLPAAQALRAQVRRLCPRWRVPEDLSFTYLPGGYSNHNFRFEIDARAYVLRLHRGPADRGALLRERRVLNQTPGIFTPTAVGEMVPEGHLVTGWQPGRLLAGCRADPEARLAYLRGLHAALAAAVPHGPVFQPPEIAWLERRPRHLPPVVRQALTRHRDLGPWDRRRAAVICHNDLNPWNVLCPRARDDESGGGDPAAWCTLDWTAWGRNDPLFDLLALFSDMPLDAGALRRLGAELTGRAVPMPRWRAIWRRYWLREFAFACRARQSAIRPAAVGAQRQLAVSRLTELR